MKEEKALRELRDGSEEALGWFIDKYSAYVSTVVQHIIGGSMSLSDVEEVTADVFLALWRRADSVRPASVKPWLGSTARNLAKNKLRERGGELPLEEDLLIIDRKSPETEWERQELNRAVRQAVLSMDWPDREIFLRHYFHGQPLAEIAGVMGLKLSTVKSRLHRGREKLKTALTAEGKKQGGGKNGSQDL